MNLTFEKDEYWPNYYIIVYADVKDSYLGQIEMVDGSWTLDTDGQCLTIFELKQIIKFMQTL